MSEKAGSKLERALKKGKFVVTMEIGPPRGPDPEPFKKKAAMLKGLAEAYNVTDNQAAQVRMSSVAGSKILLEEGLEPVMQMTCRDRNRIAMQADLLGASALGIRNCLCLSGDHQKAGAGGKLKGHPGAKNVYDVDSIQLLSVVKGMRDEAKQQSGDPISRRAPFFIGAAWTPLAPPEDFRAVRLAKKVAAGADFIQTQAVYDVPRFAKAMKRAGDMGLLRKTAVLPGIIVPRSAKMLEYMDKNLAGVSVPEELIKRMRDATDRQGAGIRLAAELIDRIREIPGVRGVHLQAIETEALLPEVLKWARLLPPL